MQFRKTNPHELDRIMELLADGRTALGALGIDQWQGGYPHREAIEHDVAHGDSYVIEDEGVLIATAMIGFSGERDYDRIEGGTWLTSCLSDNPCYAVVHRVAVDSACKGRGAATFLLDRAECLARERGYASVRIDTHPGNAPMRKLLIKNGFTECGTIYIGHADGEATPERIAYERLVERSAC